MYALVQHLLDDAHQVDAALPHTVAQSRDLDLDPGVDVLILMMIMNSWMKRVNAASRELEAKVAVERMKCLFRLALLLFAFFT